MSSGSILIVGLGSPHGDDQAGWQVADRLASQAEMAGVIIRKAMAPMNLLDWLEGCDRLIVCDACRGLETVGETGHWIWPDEDLTPSSWSGSHDLPLPAVLRLAERLGLMPHRVEVWAVEMAQRDAMADVSPAVAAALPILVDEIRGELRQTGSS